MNEKNKLNQVKSIIRNSYCALFPDNAGVDFVSINIESIEGNDDQTLRTPSSPRPKYKVTLLNKLFEGSDSVNNSTNSVKVALFCDGNGKISSIGFQSKDLEDHKISKSFEKGLDQALELYKQSNPKGTLEITQGVQLSKEVLDVMLKKIKSKNIPFKDESLKNRTFTDKDNNVWKYDAAIQKLTTDNPYNLALSYRNSKNSVDDEGTSNYTPKMN